MKKGIFAGIFAFIIIVLGLVCYFRYSYVIAEGTKEGELNYMTKKGYIFKTYEGKLIQNGFRTNKAAVNGIQSNEFEFSVADDSLALQLENISGEEVRVHYKEYNNPLPWRGYTAYVVDGYSVVSNNGQNSLLNNNIMNELNNLSNEQIKQLINILEQKLK